MLTRRRDKWKAHPSQAHERSPGDSDALLAKDRGSDGRSAKEGPSGAVGIPQCRRIAPG